MEGKMIEFEYVTKKEYAPAKKEILFIINKAQNILKEKYNITFQYKLIGSGRRHLITRVKGGNKGFDLDYNLILQRYDCSENKLREYFRIAFNKACKGTKFSFPENSTSVLKLKCIGSNKKIKYSVDLAIVEYDTDDINDGYWYLKRNQHGKYVFEFRNLSRNIEWKLNRILEYKEGWGWIRDEYIKLKNKNRDTNKHSFCLYYESIHNVYNHIIQEEEKNTNNKSQNILNDINRNCYFRAFNDHFATPTQVHW